MVNQIQLNDLLTLIVGTSAMLLMVIAIIVFAFLFQRKLLKKQQEFMEIEKLLKKQELKSAYALIEGQEQERKRIAEDLHDNIGSIHAAIRMYSDLIFEKEYDEELKHLSLKLSQLTEQAASETRRISHELDSGVIKHFGLKSAVVQLSDAVHHSQKLQVKTTVDIEPELSSELSLNVYRVIQELFNNTLKHARANSVRLDVSQIEREYLSIIFEDNGMGFDPLSPNSGIGLSNIRTRVERFKGTITIDSAPNKGTTTIIEIPLE